MKKQILFASSTLLLAALSACAESGLNYAESADGAWYDTGATQSAAPEDDWDEGGAGDYADTGYDDGYGSESENDFLQLEPRATNAYVFVANPTRDTVTRIAVDDLSVLTADVGTNPQAVETTPDYTHAVVFNQGSDDVNIIDAQTLDIQTVEVREHFNQMVLSPNGRWAICFHDPDAPNDDEQTSGGVVSFNEISLVDVQNAVHWPLVVGFNPAQIQFTDDSATAAVISDAYLALIDLQLDEPDVSLVQIVDDPADPPVAEEILLTNGFAFIRQYATDALTLVDLENGDVSSLAAGANPTDMDLGPDGEVTVVARTSQELYNYRFAADRWVSDDPVALPPDEIIGSILFVPESEKALLYTTAVLEDRYSVWDRSTGEIETWGLAKPIQSLGVTPTGESLLVIHTEENSADMDPDDPFYGEHAISLIDLDDHRSNPLLLPAMPTAYANSNDGRFGYFIMEGQPYLEVLQYDTLLYDEVVLYSQPVHVGVLPDRNEAYVNQEHDLGRLSFYDPASAVLETITGFELNSQIEH